MQQTQMKVEKYQWKKGERFGDQVEVEKIDAEFTYFTDGSRIYNNIINDYLEPFINGKPPFPSTENRVKSNQNIKTSIDTENLAMLNLINKLSKNNEVELTLELNISIPKKEFIALFESEEEKNEIFNLITEEAIQNIEINKFLKHKILSSIKQYYDSK